MNNNLKWILDQYIIWLSSIQTDFVRFKAFMRFIKILLKDRNSGKKCIYFNSAKVRKNILGHKNFVIKKIVLPVKNSIFPLWQSEMKKHINFINSHVCLINCPFNVD